MTKLDVAVVGAGPFGLSVAAHLPGRRVVVFGRPMQTWRTVMPPDMLLRSAWDESDLSAPGDSATMIDWADRNGVEHDGPIPLHVFLAYADWFRERFVPDNDPSDVVAVERGRHGFAITTAAGDAFVAARLVVAVGVTPFPYAPPAFEALVGDPRVHFAVELRDFARFDGRSLIVIGGGQGALETAARAAQAGARVEVVSRGPVRWFADREPHTARNPLGRSLHRLAYPAIGYGPPPINRIVLHPDFFAALPAGVRRRLNARLLRAGGSAWLRQSLAGRVEFTQSSTVGSVVAGDDGLQVVLDDGAERSVDDLVLATGFRFDLRKLAFADQSLVARVRVDRGWPVLDRHFRSTDPELLFVGYPAEDRFGPISRFVLGAGFTAARAAAYLRS